MRKGYFNLAMTEYYIIGNGVDDFDYAIEHCIKWCENNGLRFKRYDVKPYDISVQFKFTFEIPINITRIINEEILTKI